MQTFQERQDADTRDKIHARQRVQDLHDLLELPGGYRWMSELLRGLGAGCMTNGDVDQTMKNITEQLLDDMAEAHLDAYLRFCAELRNAKYKETDNVADE